MLKYISTEDLNFEKSFSKFLKNLREFSSFKKIMIVFWMLGPFIFLLERSPADIWLSIIGIVFIIKCILENNWTWAKQTWFKLCLLFWLTGLIASLFSENSFFSFSQGFVWIRFPLYAAAAQAWLAKDRDTRVVMSLFIIVSMLMMCLILSLELLIEPKDRLTWPYDDHIPGSYLSKVSLPIFCCLVAIFIKRIDIKTAILATISFFSISIILLTGERTNFILRLFATILSCFVWKINFKNISSLFLLIIFFVSSAILATGKNYVVKRYIVDLPNNLFILNTTENNPYWGTWRSGIQQGIEKPILGAGPSGTRHSCKNLAPNSPSWLPGKNHCANHPHNFYIQMFAETGVLGLLIGIFMILSIIKATFNARNTYINCPLAMTAFLTPLILFFPIQQFGSFYGQWGNLFIWFAIGFSISNNQLYK